MRRLDHSVNTPNFVPNYMADSVLDIDFKQLKKDGIKYVAFDADSTLVHYKELQLSKKTRIFLKSQKHLFLEWCLASNRLKKTLSVLAAEMDAEIIAASYLVRKPQKRYFKKIIKHFDAEPSEIAMIGDKLIADSWGANRIGMTSVWVKRIGPDSMADRIFGTRKHEARLMRHYIQE